MFRNLLNKEGLITAKNFSYPCSHIRFISEEKFTLRRRQHIHENTQHEYLLRYPSILVEGAQESWMKDNEEQQLEPEIEEFLACLAPHEEYVLEDLLDIVMKYVGQGSFTNWEFSEHWYELFI